MSTTSKIVFGVSLALALGTVGYVHYTQEVERAQLKQGIIVDADRQKRRQIENIVKLQQQIDLTREFKRKESEMESERV